MSTITPNSEKLEPEEIEILDPDYFTFNPSWNLLDFLIYRQKCSDFWCNKRDEHSQYTRNLSIIINNKLTHEVMKAGNALVLFQGSTCVQPPTLPAYDQEVKSTDVDDKRGTPERQIYPSELSVEKIYVPSGSTEEKEANYPSNDQYESYTGTHEDEDENPFIVKKREGLRNNNFKTILSWKHVIDSININDISRNDWMADGYNVSLDFHNFQLTSIKQLETDQTFSYEFIINNEAKPEFVLCSEKEWNKIRHTLLVPIMLPKDVLMIIAEYNT
ncbi:18849_t:CDS:2, partial [Funneliformis geosporum]